MSTVGRALVAGLVFALPLAAQRPDTSTSRAVAAPFSQQDWSWLNGNSRQRRAVLETPYFTGEFRADITSVADFNHPEDHTLVGTSESGRARFRCSSWAWAATSTPATHAGV